MTAALHDAQAQHLAAALSSTIRSDVDAGDHDGLHTTDVGHPCLRQVAYRIAGTPRRTIPLLDPWQTAVPAALRTWLEERFRSDNLVGPIKRWLVGRHVRIGLIEGRVHLYDRLSHAVIDLRILDALRLEAMRSGGPGETYRVRLHLCAAGLAELGHEVETVAVVALPLAGALDEIWAWSEPYDPAVATAGVERVASAQRMVTMLDGEPGAWSVIPAYESPACDWCPFLRTGLSAPNATGCPGQQARPGL